MRKKYLCLFLALCMLLPLAACGGTKPPAAESSTYIIELFSELPEEITGGLRAVRIRDGMLINEPVSEWYMPVQPFLF